jgi:hypothetical protein
MAGLVPAIHAFGTEEQGVDARHKAGHDGGGLEAGQRLTAAKRPPPRLPSATSATKRT